MIRYHNMTTDDSVKRALLQATLLLNDGSVMMQDLVKKADWKYGVLGPGDVYRKLFVEEHTPVAVRYYKPWNPFTKAVGYYQNNVLNINSRVKWDHTSLVGLMLHEYAHHAGFHHGNNYKTQDKCLYSVPYYLSENAGKWI